MVNYKQYKYELPYINRRYFNIIAIYYNTSDITCNFCFRDPSYITTDICSKEYSTCWPPNNNSKYLSMCKKCFKDDTTENKYFYIKRIIFKNFSKPIAEIILSYTY